jgi:hypothetical protein
MCQQKLPRKILRFMSSFQKLMAMSSLELILPADGELQYRNVRHSGATVLRITIGLVLAGMRIVVNTAQRPTSACHVRR